MKSMTKCVLISNNNTNNNHNSKVRILNSKRIRSKRKRNANTYYDKKITTRTITMKAKKDDDDDDDAKTSNKNNKKKLLFDGTSMFTIYEELNGGGDDGAGIFPSFLEAALHVCEVSKSHPNYISAHFHENIALLDSSTTSQHQQQRATMLLTNYSYLNYTLFDSIPEKVFDEFTDLIESCEIAHQPPQSFALLATSEVDTYTRKKSTEAFEGTFAKQAKESVDKDTKLSKIGLNDKNVAVVCALKCGNAEKWVETFGIKAVSKMMKEHFKVAVLHEVKRSLGTIVENDEASQTEGDTNPFTHVVYVSLGEVPDSMANDAISLIQNSLRDEGILGSVCYAYKCAFNIAKKGTPCGALPAVREIQKRKEENELAKKNKFF